MLMIVASRICSRMTLDTAGAQQVPLRQEIDVLNATWTSSRRASATASVSTTHIDSEALDALVPNLLLQPLVENAIRHGIARARPAGVDRHSRRSASGTGSD